MGEVLSTVKYCGHGPYNCNWCHYFADLCDLRREIELMLPWDERVRIEAKRGGEPMIRWLVRFLVGCDHDWKVAVERELPSVAEEVTRNGEDIRTWAHSGAVAKAGMKKFVAVLTCGKCGGIRTLVFKNR